jgi:hypothetical protein
MDTTRHLDIDWNAELLIQLEWHWDNQLRPRLDGLTDREYFWEPVPCCWSIRPRAEATTPLAMGPLGGPPAEWATWDYAATAKDALRLHHGAEISLLRDLYRWKGDRDAL